MKKKQSLKKYKPQLIVGLVVLALLVVLGLFLRGPAAGQATYVYLQPPADVIDLLNQQYAEVAVEFEWQFTTSTSNGDINTYDVLVFPIDEGETIFQYAITKGSFVQILAAGLLNSSIKLVVI